MALLAYIFPIRKKMNEMKKRSVLVTAVLLALLTAGCFCLPKVIL